MMDFDFNNADVCLQRARILLYKKQPFFASLAMGMKMQASEAVPTLGTDSETIYYNPGFIVETLKKDQNLLVSAIAHECGHKYLMHNIRQGARDAQLFNIAGDYVINLILRDSGLSVGDDWLIDDKYAGMTTEQVYNLLQQESQKQPQQDKQGKKRVNPDGCYHKPEGSGPGNTMTPDEVDAMERKIKGDIARAATQARARGHLPAGLAREIDAILNPPEPWQDILREFITNRARDDYNWMRPSRQFLRHGFALPSLQNYRMGPIVVALDTSGSVSDREFSAFMANLSSIIEDCKPECVHVLHCDAGIHKAVEYTTEDLPIPAERHGCGGTSFRPPFDWVTRHDIDPECLIYFTDTMGDFPAEPDYPVLWAAVGDYISVPWGELVEVTADE